jgi:ribosomal protein S18 acetylase RimI-like enzyme
MKQSNIRGTARLVLRPARDSDRGFIEALYRSTRDDLRLVDGEPEMIESLIDMQYRAQHSGYGAQFPEAWHFVVEHAMERIGRVVLDFGENEVRLVDIAFVPTARGKGFGKEVIKALQGTAARVWAPITLTVHPLNVPARRLYASLGFRTLEPHPVAERLVWYPEGYPALV